MTFNLLDQLKNKSWWMDVIFYFVSALLIAAVFCYFIFAFKVYLQNERLNQIYNDSAAYGTPQQKAYEKRVFDYKKQIDDFAIIIKNHKISSNIFAFIEEKTLPNVWFSSFNMSDVSGSSNKINLLGEAENIATLSRQIQVFVKSTDYIKDINVSDTRVGSAGKVGFTLNLSLDSKIFSYASQPLSATLNQPQNTVSP